MRQTKDDGNRSIETYMPRGKWLEQMPPYNKLESQETEQGTAEAASYSGFLLL